MRKLFRLFLFSAVLLVMCLPMAVLSHDVEYILNARVEVSVPKAGQTVRELQVTTSTLGLRVSKVTAYYQGSGDYLFPDHRFEVGKAYDIRVDLATISDDYYIVDKTFSATANGNRVGWNSPNPQSVWVMTKPMVTITNSASLIDISLPEPQMGGRFDASSAKSPASPVTIRTVWYDSKTGQPSTDAQFKAGKTYSALLYVTCVEGCTFTNNAKFSINSVAITSKQIAGRGGDYIRVWSEDYVMSYALSSITVDFPIPAIGQKPSDILLTLVARNADGDVLDQKNAVRIAEVKWLSGEEEHVMQPNDIFRAGVNYVCKVHVESSEPNMWEIVGTTTMSVNGNKYPIGQQWGPSYYISRSPSFRPLVQVDKVDVAVSIPRVGEMVQDNADLLATTDGTAIATYAWHRVESNRKSEELKPTDRFIVDCTYYLEVTIKPTAGYTLAPDASVTFNGVAARRNASRKAEEIECASPQYDTSTPTDRVAVSLSSPAAGQNVKDALPISSTKEVIVSSVSWYIVHEGRTSNLLPEYGDFLAGETYYCTFTLVPASGYYFANRIEVTLNGRMETKTSSTLPSSREIRMQSETFTIPKETGVLHSIVAPIDIAGIPNGTPKTVDGLRLPATVSIVTTTGNFYADVTWNVGSSSYNASMKEAQKVAIQGVVTLPLGALNPNNVSLEVQVNVAVSAASGFEAYSVSYDANGGTGAPPAEVMVRSGGSYTIAPNMFSHEGHVFSGWRTSPAGGAFYEPSTTFSVVGDTILYAQWTAIPVVTTEDNPNQPVVLPSTDDTSTDPVVEKPSAITTIEFTIDSKVVMKNGSNLPEIDVPAMIINGRTMIPFRYFIETALGGVANFDASTYTITASVMGHTIVMVVEDTTIYVDGQAVELSQAPTIINSRTLVPLRMIDTIAQSVGWDPVARKATIVL